MRTRHAGADRRDRRRDAARGARGRPVGGLESGRRVPGGRSRSSGRTPGSSIPIGKVLYESEGWFSEPPRGSRRERRRLHEPPDSSPTTAASVEMVDRAGKRTKLAGDFSTEGGLAWSPDGREVWFTAAETGRQPLALRGHTRRIAPHSRARDRKPDAPGRLPRRPRAHRARRAALGNPGLGSGRRQGTRPLVARLVVGVATSRRTARSSCSARRGRAAAPNYSAYSRRMDGSPPVRLGDGNPYVDLAGREVGALAVGQRERAGDSSAADGSRRGPPDPGRRPLGSGRQLATRRQAAS